VRKGASFRSVAKSVFSLGAACGLLTCTGSREPTGVNKVGPVAAIIIVSGQDQVDTSATRLSTPSK